MADKPEIDIEELREAGEDGGDLMGYFARGHFEAEAFSRAANQYSRALTADDRRHVRPAAVKQVWYRTVQMQGEPSGTYEFRPAEPGTRGAWKATVCESVSDHSMKRVRERIREYDRGYQEGLSRALGFLLAQLEWGEWGNNVSTTMRRAIAGELRASFERGHEEMTKAQTA